MAASFYLLAQPNASLAEQKEIISEASYMMGDGETPSFAEAMVLQKAKQMALEQAGTYVQSYTKVRNMDLTADEITTIAGGVLETEILKKERSLEGNMVRVYMQIRAAVTTDRMEELARKLRGHDVSEEYKKLQQQYTSLMRDLEYLKASIAKLPTGPERDAALERVRDQEKNFRAIQKHESELFERLISGEALLSEALDQISKKESERQLVDGLMDRLIKEGYTVSLGEPKIQATLDDRNTVTIDVPVTVKPTSTIKSDITDLARRLGGGTLYQSSRLQINSLTAAPASTVQLGKDVETVRYVGDRMSSLVLQIEARVSGGSPLSCYVASEPSMAGIRGHVYTFGIATGTLRSDLSIDYFLILGYPDLLGTGGGGYILMLDEPISFTAQISLPLMSAKRITSFTGRIADRAKKSEYRDRVLSLNAERCKVKG